MKDIYSLDITETIENGDVKGIINILQIYLNRGYDRLFWDGYDSSIWLCKSKKEPITYDLDFLNKLKAIKEKKLSPEDHFIETVKLIFEDYQNSKEIS